MLILFFKSTLFAQTNLDNKRDYEWLFGYRYSDINYNLIDFNEKPSKIGQIIAPQVKSPNELNAQISDKKGKLLLYTYGCDIRDSKHNIVQGGDSIGYGNYWDLFCAKNSGSTLIQGAIILPNPMNDNKYHIFQTYVSDEYKSHATKLLMHEVDMSLNSGKGKVIVKNKVFYNKIVNYSKMTACRHANGKDWWLVIPERTDEGLNSPYYLSFLYTGDSIYAPIRHNPGNFLVNNIKWEADMVAFSPDGTKYARTRSKENRLYLYDFDRSTGLLSKMRTTEIKSNNTYGSGVAFSPDSKLLYISSDSVMYQINTEVKDLEDGVQLIGTYDKYVVNGFFPTSFMYSMLAPDCKIYVATGGTTEFIHVVNYPNRKGLACGLEQRALKMPTKIAGNLPNYPHYRLGKLGEAFSPCDSTINPYIKGDFTSMENVVEQPITVAVYPNPAQQDLNVDLFGFVRQYNSGHFDLYNLQGQLVQSYPLLPEHDEYRLDISKFNNGIYIWQLVLDSKVRKSGKVVKME